MSELSTYTGIDTTSHQAAFTRTTMDRAATLRLLLIVLLQVCGSFCIYEPYFDTLPQTVGIPENSVPGTTVYSFTLGNWYSMSTVSMTVSPATTFFNNPSINSGKTATIKLSSSAALNALMVNQYNIAITYTNAYGSISSNLYVQITPVSNPLQCATPFSSQVGDTVQVLENVPKTTKIYTATTNANAGTIFSYNIKQVVPNGDFTIDASGNVYPNQAFNYQTGDRSFTLTIKVLDQHGASCLGTLTVEVLPIDKTTISFKDVNQAVTIRENTGPAAVVATVTALGTNVHYQLITPTSAFQINEKTGVIRTTYNLDLDSNPGLAVTSLLVRAYDPVHKVSATATVQVTVQDANDIPPLCTPAVVVTHVPETTPIAGTLFTLSCSDRDSTGNTLSYSIQADGVSRYMFRLQGTTLELNNTLDYDSAVMAGVDFQYPITILIKDSGVPQLTTSVSVFVTVTPVNEFPPTFKEPFTFTVNERSPVGTVIGVVTATDHDWPFNNVQYRITGGNGNNPPQFYIDPRSGQINLLSTLDFERQSTYQLKIEAVDMNQDLQPDPNRQKTALQTITIEVQDTNDNPPVCNPPYYEATIFSTLKAGQEIVLVQCTDQDITSTLTYTLVGGNVNNRFTMTKSTLVSQNTFSYLKPGVYDPTTYELLVKVTDGGPPTFSTTVTVIVHVIPWTTTVPTTPLKTTKVTQVPQIVTVFDNQWIPDPWFVAVLAVTGALLLLALALLIWKLLSMTSLCRRVPTEMAKPLLQDRTFGDTAAPTPERSLPQDPRKNRERTPSPLSLQFDGRAQDPFTGREYLFSSVTGQRCWV
ncbi:cadherin-related family member 4-like isoform X1 [Acipenser ruthenus]|uniref:cadherin-related family member 4-like isoform X1 n=1 Tax=Acipenser ruthenus TaxID=7906 RepID=UPI0027417984|nr:cadherin-related family member 4-like isoform X1 [Acipenser ruthenus]